MTPSQRRDREEASLILSLLLIFDVVGAGLIIHHVENPEPQASYSCGQWERVANKFGTFQTGIALVWNGSGITAETWLHMKANDTGLYAASCYLPEVPTRP